MTGSFSSVASDYLIGDGYDVEFLETREPNDQKLKVMVKLSNFEEGFHLLNKQT